MKTFEVTVVFTKMKTYKIRAKDAESAGKRLFNRVQKTAKANRFDNPQIFFTSDDDIKEHSGIEY